MLEGKSALVTGASRGIGRAIALTLADSGTNIIVNYAGNEEKAQEVVSEIESRGKKAVAVRANVADASEVKSMVRDTLDHFETIDILVNNAGITRDNLLMRMKDEEWDEVIDTNLKGVFNCIRAVVRPMMKQRAGRIINISSVSGIAGNPGQANYGSAKAGIIGLTKTAAKEFASRGITVNAVAPGFIETDMTAALHEDMRKGLLEQIPLARLGKPEDIAYTVRFLASGEAGYITGQTIQVNGGMAM